jgi:hypothetical protein
MGFFLADEKDIVLTHQCLLCKKHRLLALSRLLDTEEGIGLPVEQALLRTRHGEELDQDRRADPSKCRFDDIDNKPLRAALGLCDVGGGTPA